MRFSKLLLKHFPSSLKNPCVVRHASTIPHIDFTNSHDSRTFLEPAFEICSNSQVSHLSREMIGTRPDNEVENLLYELQNRKHEILANNLDLLQIGKNNDILDLEIYSKEDVKSFLKNELECSPENHEWKSRLNSFIEDSLIVNQWLSLQDDTVEDYDEIVQDKISSLNQDVVKALDQELLKYNLDIPFRDLFSCILTLTLWPRNHTYSSSCEGMNLRLLYTTLCKLSNQRYNFEKATHPHKITDPYHKLLLCKAWVEAEQNGKRLRTSLIETIPYRIVNRSANDTHYRDRAKSFFSKFTPSELVDFARILRRFKNLPLDFHKYYTIYKFYEYFDFLENDQLAVICKALDTHKIRTDTNHPISQFLFWKLFKKVGEYSDNLSNKAISHIDDYIGGFGLVDVELFENLCSKAQYNKNLDAESLTKLLSYRPSTLEHESTEQNALYDRLHKEIKFHPSTIVDIKTIQRILRMVRTGYFDDEDSSEILSTLTERAIAILESDSRRRSDVDILVTLLWFAYNDVFDERLYNVTKYLPNVFAKTEDGKIETSKGMIYSDVHQKNENRKRYIVKVIDGVTKWHGKDVLKLSPFSVERIYSWSTFRAPTEYSEFCQNGSDNHNWSRLGVQILKIFREKAMISEEDCLDKYIVETKVIPSFELVDYVFCLDSKNNVMELPECFLNQSKSDVKRIPPGYEHYKWFVLTLIQPNKMLNFRRRLHDPKLCYLKFAKDLGYKISLLNAVGYKTKPLEEQNHDIEAILKSMLLS